MRKVVGLKKVLSLFLALTMVFSMLPVNALAQNIVGGEEVQGQTYQEGDTIWLPEGEEPSQESHPLDTERGDQWVNTQQTKQELTCGVESHGHTYPCADPCEKIHTHVETCYGKTYTCGIGVHIHDAGCNGTVWNCGQEESAGHAHVADCYHPALTCEINDPGHQHEEICYAVSETPTCGIAEVHEHDAVACYAEDGVTLTCTQVVHTHGDGCYGQVLTCGKEVGEGAHVHVETCYTIDEIPDCGINEGDGAHLHAAAGCTSEEKLICGKDEHTHTEECSWEYNEELVCGLDDTHVCVTEGCTPDCAEAHHTDSCYTTMVMWGVANYGISATAETVTVKVYVRTTPITDNVAGNHSAGVQNPSITVTDANGNSTTYNNSTGRERTDDNYYSYYTEITLNTSETYTLTASYTDSGYTYSSESKVITPTENQSVDVMLILPIRFFVAAPGNASNPNGSYVNYKQSSWPGAMVSWSGMTAAEQENIISQNGYRDVSDESIITKYVQSWPSGYDYGSFKDFDSIRIGNTTYYDTQYDLKWVTVCWRNDEYGYPNWENCGCGANYDHIHIDGVLTKKVEPGAMNLYKEITEQQEESQTFTFSLKKLNSVNNAVSSPVSYDDNFGTKTMTATVAAGQTQATIQGIESLGLTFGFYEVTENSNSDWTNTANYIGPTLDNNERNSDPIYVQLAPNGSVRYSKSATSGYTTSSSGAYFHNEPAKNYTVHYQWKVYDVDGTETTLPAGSWPPPNDATGYGKGDQHTFNTGFTSETSYPDYERGLLFTFSGWTNYSLESEHRNGPDGNHYLAMPTDSATIPVNGDTWINGYWSAEKLDPADAYLRLDKVVKVTDQDGNEIDNTDVMEKLQSGGENRMFITVETGADKDGDGKTFVDVDYNMTREHEDGVRVDVYQYEQPFTFTEKQADVPGYIRTTTVKLEAGSNLSWTPFADNSTQDTSEKTINTTATVYIEDEHDPAMVHDLGTVTYTNTYTKVTGEAVQVYPQLELVKSSADRDHLLQGAVFTLYSDETLQTAVDTYTTDATGSVVIDFTGKTPGYYYLTETTAPTGYVLSDDIYTIALIQNAPVEELRQNENGGYVYAMVTYFTLEATIPEGSSTSFYDSSAVAGQAVEVSDTDYILDVYNERILGDLTISKTFYCEKDQKNFIPAAGSSILVDIYGPVEYADDGVTIASIGNVVHNDFVIDSDDQWTRTISDLPYGDYFVEEVQASIHGYIWNSTKYNGNEPVTHAGHTGTVISVTEPSQTIDLHIENRYTEWDAADLYIEKTDEAQTDIAGAVFKLTDADGNDVTNAHLGNGFNSATTNVNGQLHLTGFKAAEGKTETFYLEEVQAAPGYYLGQHKWMIKVSHVGTEYTIDVTHTDGSPCAGYGANEILTVSNTPILGQITVSKIFTGDAIPENTAITVSVTGNGVTRYVDLTGTNGWTATVDELPLGEYTVTEQPNVAGYEHKGAKVSVNGQTAADGTSATVTLSATGGTYTDTTVIPDSAMGTVAFTNEYQRNEELIVHPASLTIVKTDENGKHLSGATFTLYNDEGCTDPVDINDADIPDNFTTSAESDRNGAARFYNLKLDDLAYDNYTKDGYATRSKIFYLQESQAPEGYVRDTTVWEVKLTEEFRKEGDSKVYIDVLNADRNMFETILDWIAGITGGNTNESINADLVVKNTRIKADLEISKKFVSGTMNNGVFTPDAEGAQMKPTAGTIHLDIYGPVVYDGDTITDVGPVVRDGVTITYDANTQSWTTTVEDLTYGKYFVEETMASLHNYTWVSTEYNDAAPVTVGGHKGIVVDVSSTSTINLNITNHYTEWESADFWIYKTDKDSTDLAGAEFKLYDGQTDVTAKYCDPAYAKDTGSGVVAVTGVNGRAHFQNFELAANESSKTFTLQEVMSPDNYATNEQTYSVTVTVTDGVYDITVSDTENDNISWDHDDDLLTVFNEEILGSITIQKTFGEDGKGTAPTGLNEIKVNVYNAPNTIYKTVTLKPDTNQEDGVDTDWKATLTDVPMGTYAIQEQNADAPGYTLAISYSVDTAANQSAVPYARVTLDEGTDKIAPATVLVTINNSYTRNEDLQVSQTSFQVKKVDKETGEPLQGAKFALFNGNAMVGSEVETDAEGIATFENVPLFDQEPVFGDYTDKMPESVVYTLQETTAPAGYVKSDTTWTVTLTEDRVKVNELNTDKNLFETIVDWVASITQSGNNTNLLDENNVLTVENERIKGNITISKSFSFPENADVDMDKVEVTVHVHGPVVWDEDENEILDLGPAHEITLTRDDLKDNVWTETIPNLELGDYAVRETFASVHGYNWDGGSYTDGEEYTHSNGYKFQIYSLVESNDAAENVTVDITNGYTAWESVDFYVHKTDDQGKSLSGAIFGLYTKNGQNEYIAVERDGVAVTATTDIDGMAHFTGITADEDGTTYYVKEIQAPAGHIANSNVWEIEVTNENNAYQMVISGPENTFDNDKDRITVVNNRILADLTIQKAFVGDAVPDDITINVTVTGPNGYNAAVKLAKDKDTSDNVDTNWKATLEDLPLGTYTITEDTALADILGYDLISTKYSTVSSASARDEAASAAHTGISVEFTDTKTDETVTITNTYKKNTGVVNNPDSFTILKTDDRGNPLPGAVFTLTNDYSPTQIRTFTTGADGKVVVDGLIGHGTVTDAYNIVYTLAETTAPTGHTKSDELWKITIQEEDNEPQIVVNTADDRYDTIWDWIIGAFVKETDWNATEKVLTVKNARQTVPVSVTKTVDIKGLASAEQDKWVQKNILNKEYKFELYIDDVKKETVTVKAGETKNFETQVPYGSKYEVKEVIPTDAVFTSTLTDYSGEFKTTSMTAINVTAVNTYTFTVTNELTLDLYKVASGTYQPLGGASFTLYNEKGAWVDAGTSGADGGFTITIPAAGKYSLKETVAPIGYNKLNTAIKIDAEYAYTVAVVDGQPVICKVLTAAVDGGRKVVSLGNDTYQIKNNMITSNPGTGDNIMVAVGVMVTAAAALVLMFFFARKNRKYHRD